MTTEPLSLDNGFHTEPKERPVVIQVHEVPITSPLGEKSEEQAQEFVNVGSKAGDASLEMAGAIIETFRLKGSQSGNPFSSKRPLQSMRRRGSSLGSVDGQDWEFEARGLNVQRKLIHFPSLGAAQLSGEENGRRHSTTATHYFSSAAPRDFSSSEPLGARPNSLSLEPPSVAQSWPYPYHINLSSVNGLCGIVPPLTPPEELGPFKWEPAILADTDSGVRTVSNAGRNQQRGQGHQQSRNSSSSRPSEIQMPERSSMGQDESSRSNWLGRACQCLVASLGDTAAQQQIQMVVQALPSQGKSVNVQPLFEKVVEAVENHYTYPPYITITHAVSQVMSMDEVPASPPATPNTNYSSDDYFQDQTIFTHAAVVPAYHHQPTVPASIGARPSNIITAPSSIHLSILERYIPPTTAEEVNDFFTLSRRSYLADRLLELCSNNGTLLLVYPTRTGAATFANRYIGPIIEPFLRQFILVNGLYTHVAANLGKMASVEGMKSFEEMERLVAAMCERLNQRSPPRSLPSRYEIVHAETAEVVLEGAIWKDWYIDQEQPRLRQNLVDYHKAGGRMPSRVGQIEVTTSMLAREVVDGIRQSRETAGNAGMEVGVFVIRRLLV
ncbi:hypothetical protein PV11_06311 [Exophiala sideris]|uniref:Uncharacterized protein n=1 Tax=Exophiala sideris TaxID=1016849 RepID=A0A0D1Y738_9EURO|nr:hypothetical protein PV11_06311 [Exophiala sideris]